jgi:hypothetical protein
MPEPIISTPVNPSEPVRPGDEGYEAYIESVAQSMDATAQSFENEQQTESTNSSIPDYVPEKFRSAADPLEAMAKAYAELEKKLGETSASKGAGKTIPQSSENTGESSETKPAPGIPILEDSRSLAEKAGVDFDALYASYLSQGSLSEEQFAKFQAAGYSRTFIQNHINGKEALAREAQREVLSGIGGEEAYSKMIEWASTNLNSEEITRFNTAVENPNREIQKLAVSNLKMQYDAGAPPQLLTGTGRGSSSDGVFTSEAQVVAAMSDPRYQDDPAYQRSVSDKLSRSPGIFEYQGG